MSRIFLVRHAQASFLEPDYDKLSPIGETQARLLGEYWASRNIAFDGVYSGPRVRQIDTAKLVANGHRRLGVAFPELVVMQEFDEYQGEDVLRKSVPELLQKDAGIRDLHAAFKSADSPEEKRKSFQRMFEIVVGRWVQRRASLARCRILASILFPSEPRTLEAHIQQHARRAGGHLQLWRPDWRGNATRPESFAARYAGHNVDVAQLLLQRVFVFGRAIHIEHVQRVSASRRPFIADLSIAHWARKKMADFRDHPAAVRSGEELDLAKLEPFLRNSFPTEPGALAVEQFPSGHSNLTYLLRIGEREIVLRRPPYGSKVKTAHDMGREYRVLSKLHSAYPLAPKVLLYCDDDSILGAPFYLMERIRGIIIRRDPPTGLPFTAATARRLGESFVDNLSRLHGLDYVAVGLDALGKPQGYLARQVSGWIDRYYGSQTHDLPESRAHRRLAEGPYACNE